MFNFIPNPKFKIVYGNRKEQRFYYLSPLLFDILTDLKVRWFLTLQWNTPQVVLSSLHVRLKSPNALWRLWPNF